MEFLFMLQLLLIQFLPLLFVIIYLWSLYYLCMPIDLLLQFEEGDLHPSAFSNIISEKLANERGGQQPSKSSGVGIKTMTTADIGNHGDDDLKPPVQCSSDSEDACVVECGSEGDKTERLVITAVTVFQQSDTQLVLSIPSIFQYFNTRMSSVNVPEQSNVQVSPPVVIPQQLTPQVAQMTVREVPPPAAKENNLPTLQEIQNTCNTRYQDTCDDSEPEEDEEEEEDRESSAQHESLSCDRELEKMILQGALLCSSDTKLDQAGKSEGTASVEKSLIEGDDISKERSQASSVSGEVNKGDKNEEPISTMLSNSALNSTDTQPVDAVNQIHLPQQMQEDDTNSGNEVFPDCTSPND